ncbi:MAG: undecaprenyl-diphosphate phosphatase [Bacillota bacterium]|nr:undecaprenyl-diphosphate phosphatase [Bacillota bacterium]
MELIEIIKSIVLGIIQGITEWLPISSTGHLILVEDFMKFNLSDAFVETFMVVIQLGSILAVVVLFFKKLNPFSSSKTLNEKEETLSLWTKIIIASIPGGLAGFLFDDPIEKVLYNPITVACTLIGYGFLFIIVENWNHKSKISDFKELSYLTAVGIGLFQMLALIPGTSRSGATIIGAVLLGTSRYIAAEFSFFMAIPIMFAASGYKLLKAGFGFSGLEWTALCTGSLVAFLVSIFAIKFLMGYIKRHDFKVFGYYRIMLGIVVLGYFLL